MIEMDFGLETADLKQIKSVFAAYSKVEKAILFGSRAIGNYKAGSDIDIAITGDLTFSDLLEIDYALDKIHMLYNFDLQLFNNIRDKDILDHIQRVGKILYP